MSEKFAQVRAQLLRERQDLLHEVSNSYETCRELGQDGVPDIGDMSSAAYSRDVLFNVSETQRQPAECVIELNGGVIDDIYPALVEVVVTADRSRATTASQS